MAWAGTNREMAGNEVVAAGKGMPA